MTVLSSITLYRNTNFHDETPVTFNASEAMSINSLKDYKINDSTSSLTVKGTGTWILYQNINCGKDGGDKWSVTATGGVDGTGAYPDPSWWQGKNDSISSLQYIPNAQ